MPASRLFLTVGFLAILATSSVGLVGTGSRNNHLRATDAFPGESSGLNGALGWLVANQSSTGSYGSFQEHWTAAAAYALWLNNSNSKNSASSYSWLASQLDSSNAWFWGLEADIPGAALFSIASSRNLPLINSTFVEGQLLQLQNSTNGGFEGYSYCSGECNTAYPAYVTVTSSVDTDMALLGLSTAGLIPAQNKTLAVNYLLSLQNSDGSFNLTSTRTYDPIYSLGPDPLSITALTLLALKNSGIAIDQTRILAGLGFLSNANLQNLCSDGHTYAAALSTLAFESYNQSDDAARSGLYLLSQQNRDGGFSDISRSDHPDSNALDTGWAAVALEKQQAESGAISQVKNCPPIATFSFIPSASKVGAIVHFNASASSNRYDDQLSYNWTFGDGSTTEGVAPVHNYTNAGNYTVTLTVTDSGTNPGPLSSTESQNIVVEPTSIQASSTLPLEGSWLLIAAGTISLIAIIWVAFYLGQKSARRHSTPSS